MRERLANALVIGGFCVLITGIVTSALLVLGRAAALGAPGGLDPLVRATVGTVVVAGGAGLLAAPIGVGLALWARWLAPPVLRRPAGLVLNVLGDVPPACLAVALLALPATGTWGTWALLLAGVALVCTPAVAGRALGALDRVPEDDVLQAIALGARPGEAVASVVLPRARRDLLRSAFAGVSRASGETVLVVLLLAAVPGQALPGTVVVGTLTPPSAGLAAIAATVLVGFGVLFGSLAGRPA